MHSKRPGTEAANTAVPYLNALSRPLRDFVAQVLALCGQGGLVGAEYMMPVEPRQETIEHYLEQGAARRYFGECELMLEAYTPTFTEAPHIGQLAPHTHRMGFIIARRPPRARERETRT